MKTRQSKTNSIARARTTSRDIPVSDMRQRWLEAYIETGDATEAARIAGYKTPTDVSRSLPYEMKHQIEEACADRIGSRTPLYLSLLENLATDAKSEQVKFAALRDLLDRGKALRGQRLVIDRFDHMSESELWTRLVDAMGQVQALAFMGKDYVPPESQGNGKGEVIEITAG